MQPEASYTLTDLKGRPLAPGFDPELFLLKKQVKKAVKKEAVSVKNLTETSDYYAKQGLAVIADPDHYSVDPLGNFLHDGSGEDRRTTLIVALNEADAKRAFALHLDEDYDTPSGAKASRDLGKMLGYPECCTDFFLKLKYKTDDDNNIFETLLNTAGALDPLANVTTPCQLITHVCCSFNCENTIKIAKIVLDGVSESHGRASADEIMKINSLKAIFLNKRDSIFIGGREEGDRLHYSEFSGTSSELANLLEGGDSLRFDGNRLYIYKNDALIRRAEIEGRFFNWGGPNKYEITDPAILAAPVVSYIENIVCAAIPDGIRGWRFRRTRLVEDEIFLDFENEALKKTFALILKKRSDLEKRFTCSLNFNITYQPREGGDPGLDDLIRVAAFALKTKDTREITDREWDYLRRCAVKP